MRPLLFCFGFRRVGVPRSVAIVVAIVPISLLVPAVLMLIPPAMVLAPASLAGCTQFAPFVVCLSALPPVMLNGFVQVVFRVFNTPLALFFVFRVSSGYRGNCPQSSEYSTGQ